MRQSPITRFIKKPLAASIATALLISSVGPASAANFELGDFDISFNSTFSIGASWRTENRNWEDNVGISNNINNGFNFSQYHPALNANPTSDVIWQGQGSYSNNGDLGNLNYDAGDSFSRLFKGTHELDIRKDNIGVFLRGMYFYDFEMMDSDRPWSNAISGEKVDPCRDDDAKDQVCRDIRLLDAYFYGDFDIGEMPFSVRIGQQVIGWGESLLISHGISEINPIDVARLKAPGAELTEGFIPFGAVWASLGVSENFNIEMFYQYQWEKTILPAPGSYFSTNDFAGDGGHYNNIQLGFTGNPDIDLDTLIVGMNQIGDMMRSGDPATMGAASAMYMAYPTKLTLKAPGESNSMDPEDGGQYGLRLSWYLPEFNETEISLYYVNYHSRRPFFSGKTADFSAAAIGADLAFLASNNITEDNYQNLGTFSQVILAYPEDIKMSAFSFNTTIADFAVSGEVSYRQDEPLQIDDVELLFAAMPQQLAHPDSVNYRPDLNGISQMDIFAPGETAQGYILSDTVQAQMAFTRFWGPSLGAGQFTTVLEVGGININDMPDQDVLRLNGPGTARNGGIEGLEGLEVALQGGRETNPFPDEFAWGYRVVAKLDYSNVISGVNMSPKLIFSHDVSGITPDPIFLFVEDRKSLSAGVTFDYQSQWSADITYNSFWGGVGTTNQIEDRDYISFNIKYSL
ncbi:DUF1302 domain-containing protein [Thalassotalea profundi]|uniref:DUF1302 domain-containing protein n=1 Tax=Thalassotalea profundi TaxID=2036687 RepID=A0ABQ3IGJ0_9GAMM|nr:DUF1302 domain-containing protein [Thalassotalea profundi]GHE83759.1 hypothetical protein GCM10011501_10480 [Thalassotalea profundi]